MKSIPEFPESVINSFCLDEERTCPFTALRNDGRKIFFAHSIRFLISVFFLTAPVSTAFAQRLLTLTECIDVALSRSYGARNAKEQLHASEASAKAARKALYSTVDLLFDAPDYERTLQSQFDPLSGVLVYYPMENLTWRGTLSINQPLIWTNSTITLYGLLSRQDQNANGFTRDYYMNFAVSLRQPLFVPNTLNNSLKRAEIDYEEALAQYKQATLDLVYNVTASFYRLYSAQEQVSIQKDRVLQQEESYNVAMRKYKSGLIAEVDALQFEVDLSAAKNDLLSADNTNISQSSSFKLLLGLPLKDSISLVLSDTTFQAFSIEPETAISFAKKTRVDLQRARNNITRSEISLEEIKASRRIRGDVYLSYGVSKDDPALRPLFVNPPDARMAKFTLTVPVFDWGKHGQDIEAAEAQLRSTVLSNENLELTIEQEITDLIRSLQSSAARVEVLFKSKTVAEKANFISSKRYESGMIGSTELSQTQTRLLQARLSALQALLDYNISLADLTRRTAYDFGKNVPVQNAH